MKIPVGLKLALLWVWGLPRTTYYASKTLFIRTDYRRWEKNTRQAVSWDGRNVVIAGVIPDGSSVLDVGSGAQSLRKHLKLGCAYQPCDLVQSSPDCLVCDFNKGEFPRTERQFDYVICSGVMEYIHDPRAWLAGISRYGRTMVLSYAIARPGWRERWHRRSEGWVNHLGAEALAALFATSGLTATRLACWNNQTIYLLQPKNGVGAPETEDTSC